MRVLYTKNILLTLERLKSRDISPIDAEKLIAQADKEISAKWMAYKQTYLTPREKNLADGMDELMTRSRSDLADLQIALRANDAALIGTKYDKLNPLIEQSISRLNELITLQVAVSAELYQNSKNIYAAARIRFAGLISLMVLCAIGLSYIIIRDAKRMIEELRDSNIKITISEAKCRSFIEFAGDAILIISQDLIVTDINDSASDLFGYTRDELIGMKVPELFSSGQYQDYNKRLDILRESGGTLHERIYKRKDGSEVETEINVRKLQEVGYIAIIRDISDRKKAELAIRESEKKYRYLFSNVPACIIIWDLESLQVLEVNDAIIEKYGYSREEWNNMSVLGYREPKNHDQIREFAKMMLTNDDPIRTKDWIHLKKSGEEMVMRISSHRLLYNGRKAILSLATDITAETALKKSEEKFRTLIEHAADAIFMITDDAIIFDVNQSATDLVGYAREELIGMSVLVLHPPHQQELAPTLWDTLRKQNTLLNELQLRRKDGSTVEVEISRKMLDDKTGAIAIVRDITVRKQMELQLELSEEKHRALIENISDAIVLHNENGEITYQSPSAERISGYRSHEVIGEKVFEFIHADDLHICIDSFRQSMDTPGVPIKYEFRILHRKGHFVWIEGKTINLLHNNSIKAFVVTYSDISERKIADENLLKSFKVISDYRHALDESSIVAITDPRGKILHANENFCKISKYALAELIGKDHHIINSGHHPKAFFQDLWRTISAGEIWKGEVKNKAKDGSTYWVDTTIVPFLDEQQKPFRYIAIRSDITERKKAEEEILALNESLEQKVIDRTAELQEANKALEAFSYSVSHDLRSPAAAINGFTKIILEDYASGFSDDLRELFTFIAQSGKRMSSIIDDLLTLARYDKVMPKQTKVDMALLLRSTWDNLLIYHPHRATLEISALPHAFVDPSLIEQVLINLLSNAIKYSSKKEQPVITIGYEMGDGTVTYSIRDNGAGFDMKNYNRLFGAFQRLHGSGEFEGTGVGLLLVKRIVEKHGGIVRAEGVVGEGATFYFTLPIAT
jgi:PAS domain S-box-containing protein